MSGPPVNMPCFSMTVIRFGMHVEQRDHQHPQSRPYRDDETKPLRDSMLWLEHRLNLTPFCSHSNAVIA